MESDAARIIVENLGLTSVAGVTSAGGIAWITKMWMRVNENSKKLDGLDEINKKLGSIERLLARIDERTK